MAKRSIARFNTAGDVWPVIETWARERDYQQRAGGAGWRRYQQGHGLLVAPKLIEVSQQDKTVEVQGWVKIDIFMRLFTLFLMPSELDLGKGMRAVLPRSTARRDMNILLARFGQSPIG